MQAVEFLLICTLLSMEPFAQLQQFFQSRIRRRDLSAHIAEDSTQPRPQLIQLPTPSRGVCDDTRKNGSQL